GKRKTHSLKPLSSVGNAMQPSVSDDEHISNDREGTKRVCSAGDLRCCQGALTFVHVVVHFLIWTFPNERHAISAIALPRVYVAAHMCLDPLHGLSMGIRNRAVVIYRDDQSCTHPGPFWLTAGGGSAARASLLSSRWLIPSLYDPVRPLEHLWRDRDANLLRRLEVDDQLGAHDDLERQVGGLRPLDNPVYIDRHAPRRLGDPGAIPP